MARTALSLLVLLGVAFVAVSTSVEMAELSEVFADETLPSVGSSMPGKISLIELRAKTLDAVKGTAALTDDDTHKAKSQFMSMMFDFQSQAVRTDSLIASRLADTAFNDAKDTGSGLDLIFRKLNELEKKITDEQKVETKAHNDNEDACKAEIERLDSTLGESQSQKDSLRRDSDAGAETIAKNRVLWRESRNTEDATHKLLTDLQKDRAERIEGTNARVDERNRALDVMVTALFMVCVALFSSRKTEAR